MTDYLTEALEKRKLSELPDREHLERLVVDNPDLERLESLLDQFNIFEAIGAVRQELRHSDFLAFLLDPRQPHGLGDALLKSLLQKVLLANRDADLPVSLIDLDVWSLEDAAVSREWQSIDVLLIDEANQLVVIIENKIDSSEHSDQLARYYSVVEEHYPGWRIIALYLTPDGTPPSDERYLAVSYGLVTDLVESRTERQASTLGPDVKLMLSHYAEMLRRHIVSDSQIDRLCKQIYQKHQRALDLIFERRPDMQMEIRDYLVQLVGEMPGVILDRSSKTYTAFTTEQLDEFTPKSERGWSTAGRMLLFQFINQPGRLSLIFEIGPGPVELRQRLFDIAQNNKPLFKPASKALTASFNRIWSQRLLSSQAYENASLDDLLPKIRGAWYSFVTHDLPKLSEVICKGMADDGS